jgi:hypothetical protein
MNARKFTLKELSQAVGRLQSLHTIPLNCEVCERSGNRAEIIVVTTTFTPVATCLMCATSLIAHSVKHRTPSLATVGSNGTTRTRIRKATK